MVRREDLRGRPPRVAHAHDGGHEPGATVAAARPRVVVAPHTRARTPLVGLGVDDPEPEVATVGRKAWSLWWLASCGASVPASVAVPAHVVSTVAEGDAAAREMLRAALERWLDAERSYAVRPSVDLDGADARGAGGRRETRLDVGSGEMLDAILSVGANDAVEMRKEAPPARTDDQPAVGVVISAMLPARSAGVVFSRNPLTGLGEVVVEAVPGPGTSLGDDGQTSDRWVHRWGEFTTSPAEPRVDEAVIRQVAAAVGELESALERPVHAEWLHDGDRLWWLEGGPMRGLDGLRVYSNRIAREVLPGVIKPLVWSVNVPLVNAAWIELLEELVGPLDVAPTDLARSFGYHAYFDMTALGDVFESLGMPRDSLELLLGLPKGPDAPAMRPGPGVARHLPRIARFMRRSLRRGRWARGEVYALRAAYMDAVKITPDELDDAALLERIDILSGLTQRAAYANIVVPLLMLAYTRTLERSVAAAGLDPAGIDPARGRADRDAWDPGPALDELYTIVEALPAEAHAALERDPLGALASRQDLRELDAALDAFLDRFGHLSDSGNDFSVPPWREDPTRVVRMILARHSASARRGGSLGLADVEARTPWFERPYLRLLWRRAGAFRVYREAVSSTYTWGYGLFRQTFLEWGARLVERGLLEADDDIFFLELDELRAWVGGSAPAADEARALVAVRRREVEEAEDLIVPDIVYGDAFVPRARDDILSETLSGNPTSRGITRGRARVVRGADDFDRVQTDDIIVIPYSDVGWTPLFARAAGVVAESGGVLSHASIVAREYGIPCVVSVEHATDAIPDGATVVVDGTSGTVLVEA